MKYMLSLVHNAANLPVLLRKNLPQQEVNLMVGEVPVP